MGDMNGRKSQGRMTRSKRIPLSAAVTIGVALLLWNLWPKAAFVPSIRLPQGVSLTEVLRDGKSEAPRGWHTNIYCRAQQRQAGFHPLETLQSFRRGIQDFIQEMRGLTLATAPGSPAVDYVTPRLGECFQTSREKYLMARELVWEVGLPAEKGAEYTFLGFVWGGTNQLRHARDRIAVIENGLLTSGIFGMRMTWALPQQRGAMTIQYLPPANRCAVIRDVKGLVKIVPLDYLKAYTDAGLVTLPNPNN